MLNWYSFTEEELQKLLHVNFTSGLTNATAIARCAASGGMAKAAFGKIEPLYRLLRDFGSVLSYIPIPLSMFVCVLGMIFGEDYSCGLVLSILCFFVVFAAFTKFFLRIATEKITAKNMREDVKVLRKGRTVTISASLLAYGDIVILTDKDIVPCDLRLIKSENLYVMENTDEKHRFRTISKNSEIIKQGDVKLPQRMWKNCVFTGSVVTSGRAMGVVLNPELAFDEAMRILQRPIIEGYEAEKLSRTPSVIPFLKRLTVAKASVSESESEALLRDGNFMNFHRENITSLLSLVEILLAVLVFSVGILCGADVFGAFFFSCLLMAFPVATVSDIAFDLSFYRAAKELSRSGASIKSFAGAEKLCAAESIFCKKKSLYRVNSVSLESVRIGRRTFEASTYYQNELSEIVGCACYASDVKSRVTNGKRAFHGEHLELCNFGFAVKSGICDEKKLPSFLMRKREFRSADGALSGVTIGENGSLCIVKGSVKSIIPKCAFFDSGAGKAILDSEASENITAYVAECESDDIHTTVAIAVKHIDSEKPNVGDDVLKSGGFTLLGVLVYRLTLDDDSTASVAMCRTSGIVPLLFTHEESDGIIESARRSGILGFGERYIDGVTLSQLDDEKFFTEIDSYRLFMNISNEQKRALVFARRKRSEVTAVCADSLSDIKYAVDGDVVITTGNVSPTLRTLSELHCAREGFASILTSVDECRRILSGASMALNSIVVSALVLFSGLILPFLSLCVMSFIDTVGVTAASPITPALLSTLAFVFLPLIILSQICKPETKNELWENTPTSFIDSLLVSKNIHGLIPYAVSSSICSTVALIFAFAFENGLDAAALALFITLSFSAVLSVFGVCGEKKLFESGRPSVPTVLIAALEFVFCLWLEISYSTVSFAADFGIFKISYITFAVSFILSLLPLAVTESFKRASKSVKNENNKGNKTDAVKKTEKHSAKSDAQKKVSEMELSQNEVKDSDNAPISAKDTSILPDETVIFDAKNSVPAMSFDENHDVNIEESENTVGKVDKRTKMLSEKEKKRLLREKKRLEREKKKSLDEGWDD